MTDKEYDKLEMAVDRYVDGLDLSDLIQIVEDELLAAYRKSASSEDVQDFIKSMQVTDEDVE